MSLMSHVACVGLIFSLALSVQRINELKQEQEEATELTFKPRLSSRSYGVRSKIQVVSDPDSYLDRIHQQALKQEDMRKQVRDYEARKEVQDCTFKPQTTTCPTYIKVNHALAPCTLHPTPCALHSEVGEPALGKEDSLSSFIVCATTYKSQRIARSMELARSSTTKTRKPQEQKARWQ